MLLLPMHVPSECNNQPIHPLAHGQRRGDEGKQGLAPDISTPTAHGRLSSPTMSARTVDSASQYLTPAWNVRLRSRSCRHGANERAAACSSRNGAHEKSQQWVLLAEWWPAVRRRKHACAPLMYTRALQTRGWPGRRCRTPQTSVKSACAV